MREGGVELRISVHHSRGRQRECVVDTAHTQGTRKEKIMQGPEAAIARSVGRAWRVLGQSSRGRVGVGVCFSLDNDYFCPLCSCLHGLREKGRENSLGKCLLTVAQLKAFDLPLIFCCLTLTCEVLMPYCPVSLESLWFTVLASAQEFSMVIMTDPSPVFQFLLPAFHSVSFHHCPIVLEYSV